MKCICAFLAAVLAIGIDVAAAASPAFDCKKASGEIESLICGNDRLALLDQEMEKTFDAAVGALGKAVDGNVALRRLRAVQRGWIKGRNDCWKAADKTACTANSYERRIGELVARYMLRKPRAVIAYHCGGNPANEVVAHFFDGKPAAIRLERGDSIATGVLDKSSGGNVYQAEHGISFQVSGSNATLEWPQGKRLSCRKS